MLEEEKLRSSSAIARNIDALAVLEEEVRK